jgi:replicative DNA helicase
MEYGYMTEKSVVRLMLLGKAELELIDPDDFEDGGFQNIARAILAGAEDPVEVSKKTGIHISEIAEIIAYRPLDIPTVNDIGRLKEAAAKRRLDAHKAYWAKNPNVGVDDIDRDLQAIKASAAMPAGIKISDALYEIMSLSDAESKRSHLHLLTPFPALNDKIGGLLPGNLITVAGRPGAGKSAMAMQLALRAAETGRVLYVSLEMRPEELGARLIAGETGIPTQKQIMGRLTEAEWKTVNDASDRYTKINLHVSNDGRTAKAVRRLIIAESPVLAVIDSVNLMRSEGENERIKLTNITREMKQIALETKIPVMITAQLNRGAEEKLVPGLSELKESGSIEEDSDIVLLLSTVEPENFAKTAKHLTDRDVAVCDETEFKALLEEMNRLVLCTVRKNRNGGLGLIPLLFLAKSFLFRELGIESDEGRMAAQRSMFDMKEPEETVPF